MRVPTLAHVVLLFLIGATFLHFMVAGRRTLYSTNPEDERGAPIGQFSFMVTGTLAVWWLGMYMPIQPVNGVAAALVLVVAIALYEWARHTIWSRRFGYGWGDHVPETLCISGPYRYVRHPVYLSYLMAFLAALIALPHVATAVIFVGNAALFVHGAVDDERKLAASAIGADYAAYRARTGMFFPRISRAGPGR